MPKLLRPIVGPLFLPLICLAGTLVFASLVGAQETAASPAPEVAAAAPAVEPEGPTASSVLSDVDVLWVCLAAFLVFFMQAGFALVETGLTRAKNACNILMKNLMDFCIGSIAYWIIGFGIMFGAFSASGWFGTDAFVFDAERDAPLVGKGVSFGWAFLMFQTVFCATAATIVSGAMAERTKFVAYVIYSAAISIIIYPVFGSWAWHSLWGGAEAKGWIENLGFIDFAGSTVVHSIGGWCSLAGVLMLGPRIGKYGKDGKINAIPGHSIPMAALGVFILWLGWFGFNPGSTTAVGGGSFAYICITTNLAGCAGACAAMITTWIMFKKPDVSFTFNGALAGLVGITAGCNNVSPMSAAIIGLMAGVLVVLAVLFFDRIKIDDPVGAISVHLVCGAFGTLAVGLFDKAGGLITTGGWEVLKAQAIGVAVAGLWAFPCAILLFAVIKATVGLRVTAEEEIEGLDLFEHGNHAYPPALIAAENLGTFTGASSPAAAMAFEGKPAASPA
jgi:Amt family ammonium transporter